MKIFPLPAIALAVLLPFVAVAQPTSFFIKNGCSYNSTQTEKDLTIYDASDEAEQIVKEIMETIGLSQNFVLKASGVKNAIATTEGGQRYILYSTTFLEKFKADANTRWAAYSVLAHEIGHHLNYHDFGEKDMRKRKGCELEADRFSGSILRMLDATLDEAQAGLKTIELEGETASHPSIALRMEAVATGWKKKDEQLQGISGHGSTDSDGDGVPDLRDVCPDTYGNHTSGCPDADEDGIPNRDDKCPFEKGLPAYKGCPDPALADRDGDTVTDHADKCPDVVGLLRYQGCPDTDGDGVPDPDDKCPREKGLPVYKGCPSSDVADRDNDGVLDNFDRCPDTKGPKNLQGCPDSDNDGVIDILDKCPFIAGVAWNFGCPKPNNSRLQQCLGINYSYLKEEGTNESYYLNILQTHYILVRKFGGFASLGLGFRRHRDSYPGLPPTIDRETFGVWGLGPGFRVISTSTDIRGYIYGGFFGDTEFNYLDNFGILGILNIGKFGFTITYFTPPRSSGYRGFGVGAHYCF